MTLDNDYYYTDIFERYNDDYDLEVNGSGSNETFEIQHTCFGSRYISNQHTYYICLVSYSPTAHVTHERNVYTMYMYSESTIPF